MRSSSTEASAFSDEDMGAVTRFSSRSVIARKPLSRFCNRSSALLGFLQNAPTVGSRHAGCRSPCSVRRPPPHLAARSPASAVMHGCLLSRRFRGVAPRRRRRRRASSRAYMCPRPRREDPLRLFVGPSLETLRRLVRRAEDGADVFPDRSSAAGSLGTMGRLDDPCLRLRSSGAFAGLRFRRSVTLVLAERIRRESLGRGLRGPPSAPRFRPPDRSPDVGGSSSWCDLLFVLGLSRDRLLKGGRLQMLETRIDVMASPGARSREYGRAGGESA